MIESSDRSIKFHDKMFTDIENEINNQNYKDEPEKKIRYIEFCIQENLTLLLNLFDVFEESLFPQFPAIEMEAKDVEPGIGGIRKLLKIFSDLPAETDFRNSEISVAQIILFKRLGELIKKIEFVEIGKPQFRSMKKGKIPFVFSEKMKKDLDVLLDKELLNSFIEKPDFKDKYNAVLIFDLWHNAYNIADYEYQPCEIISENMRVNNKSLTAKYISQLRIRAGSRVDKLYSLLPHLRPQKH